MKREVKWSDTKCSSKKNALGQWKPADSKTAGHRGHIQIKKTGAHPLFQ